MSTNSGASQVALVVKNLPANVGDVTDAGLILGLRRSPGGWHGNPLQESCLERHGERSLVGYNAEGHKGLDMIERLSTQHSTAQHLYIHTHCCLVTWLCLTL